jgi:hypothetical protein
MVVGGSFARSASAGGAEEGADRLVALGRNSLKEGVEELVQLVACVARRHQFVPSIDTRLQGGPGSGPELKLGIVATKRPRPRL